SGCSAKDSTARADRSGKARPGSLNSGDVSDEEAPTNDRHDLPQPALLEVPADARAARGTGYRAQDRRVPQKPAGREAASEPAEETRPAADRSDPQGRGGMEAERSRCVRVR